MEAPKCIYNCGTFVSVEGEDCGMCCEAAVKAREARVAPIYAAELKANEKRTKEIQAALEAKKARLAKANA